jgi:hypothetical protein
MKRACLRLNRNPPLCQLAESIDFDLEKMEFFF